ncbi:unnamed protein product [Pylaiella littoralis]
MTYSTHHEIYDAFKKCDEQRMQRRRKIDTSSLFNTLIKCCIQGRGVGHIVRMDDEQYSSQAIHLARKKLPVGAFKEVNRFLHRGPHEPRVFAVDGSEVHVHPSFIGAGYKTRTNDKPVPRLAKRPLVMLSSMVHVKTKTCVVFELTQHLNERKVVISMLGSLRKGDTLVFDRGYYSKDLVLSVHDSQAFVWSLAAKDECVQGHEVFLQFVEDRSNLSYSWRQGAYHEIIHRRKDVRLSNERPVAVSQRCQGYVRVEMASGGRNY